MSISASDVKKLRDMTGAGMMDAKKALTETSGDFDAAVKYLREKGLADSKKRADKEANQGTIGDYIHYQQDRAVSGVLVELACETDFVAKSDEFKDAAKQIAMHIAAMKPGYLNIEDISEEKLQEEKVALYAEVKKYKNENEALQKQKIFLQNQCRKAGGAIFNQEKTIKGLKKEIDRLSEENTNLRTMLGDK